jgi:hypothetical protein
MDDGESMNETGPAITFDDQELDNGTVTVSVNNASLEEGGWVAVTYQDDSVAGDPATVVAGAAELGNETEVSVTVEDAGGFPGTHTAHVITELSQTSDIGTQISDITADNVLVNDNAEVVEEMEDGGEQQDQTEPTVTFDDQTLGEDGAVDVSVNDAALEEGSWLVVTYEDGENLTIAGVSELGDEGDLSVTVEDAGGFPGTHTAHVISELSSADYAPGDAVSEETAGNVLVNDNADVTESGEDGDEGEDGMDDGEGMDGNESMDDGMDDGEDMDGNESMDDGMDDGEDMDGNESMDDGGDEGGEDTEEEGGGEGLPGFTAIGAIVALLGAAFLMKDE